MSKASESGDGEPGRRSGRKVRVEFRKNMSKGKARRLDWQRELSAGGERLDNTHANESVRAKGSMSRKRTVIEDAPGMGAANLLDGLVVAMRGIAADVRAADSLVYRCSVRRVLRSRLIAERHPIAVGDRVRIALVEVSGTETAKADGIDGHGVIEDVAPRRTTLVRQYDDRVQVIAANIDQAIIVTAVGHPPLRPHLIDRFIVAAHKGGMRPVLCINKIDELSSIEMPDDAEPVQSADAIPDELDDDAIAPLAFVSEVTDRYRNLGYTVVLTSANTGEGVELLRNEMKDRSSVVIGVSGVGKSSLLNALQPGLARRIGGLSESSSRGQHTTSTAELVRLDFGGYVVDTPGIRQFELAHVSADELEAYFIEFVDRIADCRFSGCKHLEEGGCAVRAAAERGEIHPGRYESFVRMMTQRI